MTKHSRKDFLGFAGASIAGASIAGAVGAPLLGGFSPAFAQGSPAPTRAQDADLVVHNAKVYTVDGAMPRAEAFAVKGRPVHRGRHERRHPRPRRQRHADVDAKQMTIVPGFIDTHNHATGNVLLYEVLVGNPYVVEFVTIASIIEKLRAKAQQTPAGMWVEGYFFDDTKVKDNRLITNHDLDQVSTEHPVAVHHRGGHTVVLQQQGVRARRHHQEHAESAGRHLRPRRERRTQRPRHRSRDRRAQPRRQAPDVHRGAARAARPRRPGLHLEAVRALRPHERAPRGRQPLRAAAGARARRSASTASATKRAATCSTR